MRLKIVDPNTQEEILIPASVFKGFPSDISNQWEHSQYRRDDSEYAQLPHGSLNDSKYTLYNVFIFYSLKLFSKLKSIKNTKKCVPILLKISDSVVESENGSFTFAIIVANTTHINMYGEEFELWIKQIPNLDFCTLVSQGEKDE